MYEQSPIKLLASVAYMPALGLFHHLPSAFFADRIGKLHSSCVLTVQRVLQLVALAAQ